MRVYHFLNEIYGLEALEKKRLKVSRLNDLNDPFEFLHLDTQNSGTREILKLRKNKSNRKLGILCFSKNFKNPVQWAHYANSHKGFCLGFEVAEEKLIHLNYIQERPSGSAFLDALDYKGNDFVKYMLSYKFNHWAYEEEARMVISFGVVKEMNELIFKDFINELNLVEIIIGFRSNVSVKNIKKRFQNEYVGVEVSKVKPSKVGFEMEKLSLESEW